MAISFSRPDPSSPSAVAAASFPVSRRGFDQSEVRDFLRMVSAELARLQERERFLESELRAMQTRGMSGPGRLDEETVTTLLGEEAARVLSTARDASTQIRERAEESATRLVKDAADDATRIRESALLEAQRIHSDAQSDANAEVEMAKQQGRDMVNEAREYREKVVAYLLDGYARGLTPNPDIMCNREIKFGVFLQWARDHGYTAVATGHYARRAAAPDGVSWDLLEGVDKNKDQSYFLALLDQEQIRAARFPIGHLTKSELRRIARAAGLPTADKKDSQGICFIGEVKMQDFLRTYVPDHPGPIIRAADEVLGGQYRDQFVVDPYQAGAGTSHNMNCNEVLANRANEILGSDPVLTTGRHAIVEVRRNLARALAPTDATAARRSLATDLALGRRCRCRRPTKACVGDRVAAGAGVEPGDVLGRHRGDECPQGVGRHPAALVGLDVPEAEPPKPVERYDPSHRGAHVREERSLTEVEEQRLVGVDEDLVEHHVGHRVVGRDSVDAVPDLVDRGGHAGSSRIRTERSSRAGPHPASGRPGSGRNTPWSWPQPDHGSSRSRRSRSSPVPDCRWHNRGR
mgnify:CR=1 FL=1